jgi:sulfite reductase (ferredoxin)
LEELQKRIGFRFEAAELESPPSDIFRDHVGIHPQKQAQFSYVGASVLRGRTSGSQLRAIADLADNFGSGEVRTTTMQNIILVNVSRSRASALASELEQLNLKVEPSPFWRGAVACTGTEFCKLAITETKSFTRWVVEELEGRVAGFQEQLRINVTGCPNSCGQHWISDLGLEGKKLKVNGVMQDAYYFCVGGAVGLHQAVARPIGYRCLATEVPESIERLLTRYVSARDPDENLRAFFARHSNEELRGFLSGGDIGTVERDIPSGPVPHNVEG